MESEAIATKLALASRYMFVTTEEQLKELLFLVGSNPTYLEGLLVIADSILVMSKRTASKRNLVMSFFTAQFRQFGTSLIFVASTGSSLDRRIQLQLTHKSKIVSTEITGREIVH